MSQRLGYTVKDYLEAIERYGSQAKAAQKLGINKRTIEKSLKSYREKQAKQDSHEKARLYEAPKLPSPDVPIEQILEQRKQQFKLRQARKEAEAWRETQIKIKGPIGILWFGDPHLDDDGTDLEWVQRDLDICNSSEAILAANLGDTINNWVGSLQRLYAHQDTSESTALRMAKWFCGATPWWLWIYGNHCLWPTSNTNLIKHFASEASSITQDWQARVKLKFPNGRESKIHAAHNFKGHSKFNRLHGPMSQGLETGGEADLVIAGDKHCWALHQDEHEKTGRVYWSARARGYKRIDSYGEQLGFGSQNHGASIMAVYDPDKEGPAFLTCFADAAEGADFLAWKRKKWGAK